LTRLISGAWSCVKYIFIDPRAVQLYETCISFMLKRKPEAFTINELKLIKKICTKLTPLELDLVLKIIRKR